MFEAVARVIAERAERGEIKSRAEALRLKQLLARDLSLPHLPSNSEILALVPPQSKPAVEELLRLKPVRSISGVSVITVMPKPFPCPKDRPCTYCPGGPEENTPQSYTGKEPAAARAIQHDYDPFGQVRARIEQLRRIGHEVDKVELILFGGTLTAYPREYLRWFVVQCLNALSDSNAASIEKAQEIAEKAPIRVSGIVLETRPDFCKEEHVDFMLELGVTRVELGVQTVYEDVYRLISRGHGVRDVVDATRIARDAGFAVVYHLMPNLPGSDSTRDLEMFKLIFSDERFRPDAVKIYPTLVMPGTKLHEAWLRGEYQPYPFEDLIDVLVEVKKLTPRWVRIQRIQRDIPLNLVVDGVKRGDLRSLVQRRMSELGFSCRCIRCREVGHVAYGRGIEPDPVDVRLLRERYEASQGIEVFLSVEDVRRDILLGVLRLRDPSAKVHRPELARATVVRELHVYGPLVRVGRKPGRAWQHRGYGKWLLAEAEHIAREEFDAKRIAVLSGIGARNYYQRFGYERSGPYMVKVID